MARNMGASMKRNNEDLLIRVQDTLCRVLKSDSLVNNKTAQGSSPEITSPACTNSRMEWISKKLNRIA